MASENYSWVDDLDLEGLHPRIRAFFMDVKFNKTPRPMAANGHSLTAHDAAEYMEETGKAAQSRVIVMLTLIEQRRIHPEGLIAGEICDLISYRVKGNISTRLRELEMLELLVIDGRFLPGTTKFKAHTRKWNEGLQEIIFRLRRDDEGPSKRLIRRCDCGGLLKTVQICTVCGRIHETTTPRPWKCPRCKRLDHEWDGYIDPHIHVCPFCGWCPE